MTHGTEEKILDAALIEFSQHGYAGAKTKEIADRSGLSEMTLFRRFKSKKNLFDQVLMINQEKIIKDYGHIMEFKSSDDPIQYFKNFTTNLWELTFNNFEFLSLISLEKEQIAEDINSELINNLTQIFNMVFPDKNVDSKAIVISILSFIFMGVLDKSMNRNIITHQDFDNFIDYVLNCLE